jgi:Secretion system C-terminal sorting domain
LLAPYLSMKRLIIVLVLLIVANWQLLAQRIVWESSFGRIDDDKVTAIAWVSDGYLALGISIDKQVYIPPNYYQPVTLVKLNNNGDTIFTHDMGCYNAMTSPKAIVRSYDGNYFVGLSTINPGANKTEARLYKIDGNGNSISYTTFDSTNFYGVSWVCATLDGGAILIGTINNPSLPSIEGFAIRSDPNGNEVWRRKFTPSTQTILYHAEILNGYSDRFLISGAAGQYIWAAWLDQHGNMLTQKFFFQDPRNIGLSNARVLQTPDSSYITVGSRVTFPDSANYWYISKFNRQLQNMWGQKYYGGVGPAFVNANGETLLACINSGGNVFRKYARNGNISDTVLLASISANRKSINAAAWTDGDSAVFAGAYGKDTRYYRTDFYFVKMSGVGNQYIAAAKPSIVSEGGNNLSLYPNPAKDMVTIQSTGEGSFMLYNASGQVVLQEVVAQGSQISLAHLPSGLYMYRFTTNKGVSAGKVVRE